MPSADPQQAVKTTEESDVLENSSIVEGPAYPLADTSDYCLDVRLCMSR